MVLQSIISIDNWKTGVESPSVWVLKHCCCCWMFRCPCLSLLLVTLLLLRLLLLLVLLVSLLLSLSSRTNRRVAVSREELCSILMLSPSFLSSPCPFYTPPTEATPTTFLSASAHFQSTSAPSVVRSPRLIEHRCDAVGRVFFSVFFFDARFFVSNFEFQRECFRVWWGFFCVFVLLSWVLLLLSVAVVECCCCWVLLLLSVVVVECCCCWVLLLLSVCCCCY